MEGIALHRFVGVSMGIGVALMFALVWPERLTGRFEGTQDGMASPGSSTGIPRCWELRDAPVRATCMGADTLGLEILLFDAGAEPRVLRRRFFRDELNS